MKKLLPVVLIIAGCASTSVQVKETAGRPLVFLGSPDTLYRSVVAAADSMSWEVTESDAAKRHASLQGPDATVTIQIIRRPDGLSEAQLHTAALEMDAALLMYSEYVRRAFHSLRANR